MKPGPISPGGVLTAQRHQRQDQTTTPATPAATTATWGQPGSPHPLLLPERGKRNAGSQQHARPSQVHPIARSKHSGTGSFNEYALLAQSQSTLSPGPPALELSHPPTPQTGPQNAAFSSFPSLRSGAEKAPHGLNRSAARVPLCVLAHWGTEAPTSPPQGPAVPTQGAPGLAFRLKPHSPSGQMRRSTSLSSRSPLPSPKRFVDNPRRSAHTPK